MIYKLNGTHMPLKTGARTPHHDTFLVVALTVLMVSCTFPTFIPCDGTGQRSPTFGVDILDQNMTGSAMPGGTKGYTVHVKNLGDVSDEVQLSHNDLPSGWAIDVKFNGVGMAAGETRSAIVNVTVAPDALAGENGILLLTATSLGNQSEQDLIKLTTTAGTAHGVLITDHSLTGRARPGESTDYVVQVKNIGNALDQFDLSTSDFNRQTDVFLHNQSLTLLPRATKGTVITVTAPDGALPSTNVTFTLKVASRGNATASDSARIVTFIDPLFAMGIVSQAALHVTGPGQSWKYLFAVQNLGNSPDTYNMIASQIPLNWTVTANVTKFLLGPSMVGTANVVITPPKDALALTNVSIILTARSETNTSLAGSVKLTTVIAAQPGVQLILLWNRELAGGLNPGRRVQYEFLANNTGNINDTYTIAASSIRGWVSMIISGNRTKEVPVDKAYIFRVEVIVPSRTLASTMDILTVRLQSTNYTYIKAEIAENITVRPIYTFGIIADRTSATIHDLGTANFTLAVRNLGNNRTTVNLEVAADIYVVPWVQLSSRSLVLDAYESGNITVLVHPRPGARPANYMITIKAKNENATAQGDLYVKVLETKTNNDMLVSRSLIAVLVLAVMVLAIVTIGRDRDAGKARPKRKPADEEDLGTEEEE
jgi:uncharacterized membrane protein